MIKEFKIYETDLKTGEGKIIYKTLCFNESQVKDCKDRFNKYYKTTINDYPIIRDYII
jgi:hypothetical protein